MRLGEAFPSKYSKAADLGGRTARVTVTRVGMETMPDGGQKPVLFFGTDSGVKPMVLNITNARAIAEVFGEEMDTWAHRAVIELYAAYTSFQGKTVETIRVRPVVLAAAPGAPTPEQVVVQSVVDDMLDNSRAEKAKTKKAKVAKAK
jgi:hypothetical protein